MGQIEKRFPWRTGRLRHEKSYSVKIVFKILGMTTPNLQCTVQSVIKTADMVLIANYCESTNQMSQKK